MPRNRLTIVIAFLALFAGSDHALAADQPSLLLGAPWHVDDPFDVDQVVFQPDSVTLTNTQEAKSEPQTVTRQECKTFQYREVSLNELKALKPSYYRAIIPGLKRWLHAGTKYQALIMSEDCAEEAVFFAVDEHKGYMVYGRFEENLGSYSMHR